MTAARTAALARGGIDVAAALNGGYHAAFLVGAVFALVATLLGFGIARPPKAAELQPAVTRN